MASTNIQKLRVREGDRLYLIDAPANFVKKLGHLPRGAKLLSRPSGATQLHWFVTTAAQVASESRNVLRLLQDGVLLWTYYPKSTSGLQTDLSRDRGWDSMASAPDLQWVNLISFDDTWSAVGWRLKTDADAKRDAKAPPREIFNWIDPNKKIVRLPDDLAAALKRNSEQGAFFDTLSFTNRKEYVEWVVTARRPETRAARVSGSIERLGKSWKNPRNM